MRRPTLEDVYLELVDDPELDEARGGQPDADEQHEEAV
jgi:hypothetical protein